MSPGSTGSKSCPEFRTGYPRSNPTSWPTCCSTGSPLTELIDQSPSARLTPSAGEHDHSDRLNPVQGTDFGAVGIPERIGRFTQVHLAELVDGCCCQASVNRVVLVDDVVDNTLDRHPLIGIAGVDEQQRRLAALPEIAVLLPSAH